MEPVNVKYTFTYEVTDKSQANLAAYITKQIQDLCLRPANMVRLILEHFKERNSLLLELCQLDTPGRQDQYKEVILNDFYLTEDDPKTTWAINITLLSDTYKVVSFLSKDAVAVYIDTPGVDGVDPRYREIEIMDITSKNLWLVV